MNKFVIRKLIVSKDCGNKLKNLKPGEYIFSNERYDSFFMEGVTIQAIVGKNGSGKSSLVEMIFRMTNNLSALMFKGQKRRFDNLYFIRDVVGELHYELDSKKGVLKCESDSVKLTIGEDEFFWSLNDNNNERTNNVNTIDLNKKRTETQVAAQYFYTIATNYSLQSYITNDFAAEDKLVWDNVLKKWSKATDTTSWIDGVFHKNDGYMNPIVLNPYRNKGTIDLLKEERLTTNRLCSLLWELKDEPDNSQLIDGYRLFDIKYDLNLDSLREKFTHNGNPLWTEDTFITVFVGRYNRDNSLAKAVLDSYGVKLNKNMGVAEKALRIYLAYKTLCIAAKSPFYSDFSKIGNIKLLFKKDVDPKLQDRAKALVRKIKEDKTHITLKIRQTVTLISLLDKKTSKYISNGHFNYSDYLDYMNCSNKSMTLEERTELLPPPIFRPSITLVKNETVNMLQESSLDIKKRNEILNNSSIDINSLSSGERQFIYTTSTIIYHALNLKSVSGKDRIAYKNICIALDEIEICFHPEYQRTFINKFLALIKRTKLSDYFGINVLLVTHSPFILSDIPQDNIMYIQDGHQLSRDELDQCGIKNPFCANINDILRQSFFLDQGFVGEFARQRVISLVRYLKEGENNDEWTQEKARLFINEIGEPVVKDNLIALYRDCEEVGIQEKIAIYENEIKLLKERRL